MMYRHPQRAAALFMVLLFALAGAAVAQTPVPELSGRVVDEAGILSSGTEQAVSDYFRRIEDATGAQAAVLTVASLEGDALERYSIRVVEAWELGQAGEDNGVLLLVAIEERQIRIEVGYGLEGRLTDATSGVIIREYIQPAFRAGDFDAGIINASQAIGTVVAGDTEVAGISGSSVGRSVASGRRSSSARGIPFNLGFFVIIFMLGSFGRMSRRRGSGLLSMFFWGSMLGSASRHRHGGFGGGGFGGSGFGGGGGFGGFSGGGGGFGGGGASGGW